MTVTLTFPPEVEAGLLAKASAEGLPIDRYLQWVIEQTVKIPESWPDQAPTQSVVDGIPVFTVDRPMPTKMIQDTIDAVRADRIAESLATV